MTIVCFGYFRKQSVTTHSDWGETIDRKLSDKQKSVRNMQPTRKQSENTFNKQHKRNRAENTQETASQNLANKARKYQETGTN